MILPDLPDAAKLRKVDVSSWPAPDRALLDAAVSTLDMLILACDERGLSELAEQCRRELESMATVDDVTRVVQEYLPRLRELGAGDR